MVPRARGIFLGLILSVLFPIVPPGTSANDRDGSWSSLMPFPPDPQPRTQHVAVYDPSGDRMVLYGGEGFSDTWIVTLGESPRWTQLALSPNPGVRNAAAAIYDSKRDRMIVFGGYTPDAYLGDVWELRLGKTPEWRQLQPTGTPPSPRLFAGAVYDPARDRMVVIGGTPKALNDVWELSFRTEVPSWNELFPTGVPPGPRYGHTATYDPAYDRVVVFGGANPGTGGEFGDLWELSLGKPTWRRLTAQGTPPAPRVYTSSVLDLPRRRLVLLGGNDRSDPHYADVWSLSLDGSPTWERLSPLGSTPGTTLHTAIVQPSRDRMIVVGAYAESQPRRVPVLTWKTPPVTPAIFGFSPLGGEVGIPCVSSA